MRPLLLMFVAMTGAACGGSGGGEPVQPPPATPNLSLTVTGSGQHTQAGQALPSAVTARVVDLNRSSAPVSGQVVLWVVTAGGGSVSPSSGITDASGQSSTTWVLGSSGAQSLEARTTINGSVVSQTASANIDAPAVASVVVSPHTVTAYSGWTLPPYTVTITTGNGTIDNSIPYTVTSRNEAVIRTATQDVPYAGPDAGTSYLLFSAGGKSDSLKVVNINHDTAGFYRASVADLNFSPAPDTAQFWYSQPLQGTYMGDSAVKAFQVLTFASNSFGGPVNSANPVVCKAQYSVTVSKGTLGPLHYAKGPNPYPGCDPYEITTFTWRIRASDFPPGQYKLNLRVCPLVEHPVCIDYPVGLN